MANKNSNLGAAKTAKNDEFYTHTTQIYAKIVDEQKRKAVNLIPKL